VKPCVEKELERDPKKELPLYGKPYQPSIGRPALYKDIRKL
jgi:hypothetical protein